MPFKVTVQPLFEPLTLTEVKEWLKVHVDVVEDDNLLRGLIKSARVWAERTTGQALIEQTIDEVWDNYPEYGYFRLTQGPLISVTSMKYLDESGTYQTWASTNYQIDDISNPPRVIVKRTSVPPVSTWPNQQANGWKVTYKAGNSTASAVDGNIKTAMLLQIALMYENREDMPLGRESGNPFARSAYSLLSVSRVNLI